MKNAVIALELLCNRGVGKRVSKEEAEKVHVIMRRIVNQIYEKTVAEQTRILYGASVKPTNVNELMVCGLVARL